MSQDQTSVVVVPVDVLQSLLQEVQRLRDRVSAIEARQDRDFEQIAGDICNHGQRIIKLEATEPKEPSSKVSEHLEEIAKALSAREAHYMAFWEVEELLGLSHRRVSQLADIAKNDPRFIICWHPRKKNMKVFKLNPMAYRSIKI